MKKFYSLVLLTMMMVASKSFAQGSLLATLSHDGNISAYYGAEALKSALAEADNGDIITLSSGQFNAGNITKNVVIRGAGMSLSTDSLNSHEATLIQNNFTISLADTLDNHLIMEGLYFKGDITYSGTIKNAQFMKCRFKNFIASSSGTPLLNNATFIHCRFYNGFSIKASSSAYFINCAVCGPSTSSFTGNLEFDNCFVKWDLSSSFGDTCDDVVNALYKNCILQYAGSMNYASYIPSSCVAYNCVGVWESSDSMFSTMISSNTTNKMVTGSNISTLFKSYTTTGRASYIQDEYVFELTDEAAAKYLGLDGTQVGLYGGNLVYDENPTIPQITKCNVAAKSTADGKLSVDIEVKAAEY